MVKFFVLGVVVGLLLGNTLDIIDGVFEIIMQGIELIKAPLMKKVLKKNIEIQKMQNELAVEQEPISTQCIGFQAPEEYYDDEDDYCEEDCKKKKRDLYKLNID